MLSKILLWSGLVLPWLSLLWMKRTSIYRYMPVAIFAALLLTMVSEIGYTYKWWVIKDTIVPWGYITDYSFAYGAFTVGMMWVSHFTFGRIWLYVIVNLVLDSFFAFVFVPVAEGVGTWELVNLQNYHVLLIMTLLSFILYPYQLWQERGWRKLEQQGREELSIRITSPSWFTKKEKAK